MMTSELKCVLLDTPDVVGCPPALHRHRRDPQTSNPSGKCSCNDTAERKKKSTFGSKTISQRFRKHKDSQILVDAGVDLPHLQATKRRAHWQVSVRNNWFSSLSSLNKRVLTLESIGKLRKLNTEHNRLCRKLSLKIFTLMECWKIWSSLGLDLLAH